MLGISAGTHEIFPEVTRHPEGFVNPESFPRRTLGELRLKTAFEGFAQETSVRFAQGTPGGFS